MRTRSAALLALSFVALSAPASAAPSGYLTRARAAQRADFKRFLSKDAAVLGAYKKDVRFNRVSAAIPQAATFLGLAGSQFMIRNWSQLENPYIVKPLAVAIVAGTGYLAKASVDFYEDTVATSRSFALGALAKKGVHPSAAQLAAWHRYDLLPKR